MKDGYSRDGDGGHAGDVFHATELGLNLGLRTKS